MKEKIYNVSDKVVDSILDYKEPIFINGFWRSGTTWAQQIITERYKSRPVFEPLHESISSYKKILDKYLKLNKKRKFFLQTFMPYHGGSYANKIIEYLYRVAKGSVSNRWLMRGRRLNNMLRSRAVIKMVRGHLLIPALLQDAPARVIHIRRDPRAVVASILRQKWDHWIKNINIVDQMLGVNDTRVNIFYEWEELLRIKQDESFLTRITTYWSILESFIQKIDNEHESMIIIDYEKLCNKQEEYLDKKLNNTDRIVGSKNDAEFDKESPTTRNGRNVPKQKRIESWSEELSDKQIELINYTVQSVDDELV
jgi:hypothetical protein